MHHIGALVTARNEIHLPTFSTNRFGAELSEIVLPEGLPVLPPAEGHHHRGNHALFQWVRMPRLEEVVNVEVLPALVTGLGFEPVGR